MVLGEVAWTPFPGVAPLAVLPQMFRPRSPGFGFSTCTDQWLHGHTPCRDFACAAD